MSSQSIEANHTKQRTQYACKMNWNRRS